MDGQIPFGSKVEIYGKAAFFSQLVFVFRLLIVLHHLGSLPFSLSFSSEDYSSLLLVLLISDKLLFTKRNTSFRVSV